MFVENRTVPSRSASRLSYFSCGAGGPGEGSSCPPGLDDSDPEEDPYQRYPVYHLPPGPCSHTSQEGLDSSSPTPQVCNTTNFIYGESVLKRSTPQTLLNCDPQPSSSSDRVMKRRQLLPSLHQSLFLASAVTLRRFSGTAASVLTGS